MRGDSEHGVQFVGQCQGMIHDIPTVDVLIQRILEESMTAHQEQVTKIESSNNRNGGKRTAV